MAGRGKSADIIDVPLPAQSFSMWDFLRKRFQPGDDVCAPDFILGAGHRTHWPMLCARRAFGGQAIALMSPSLPLSWFDRVVIPEHDNRTGRNVIVTRGVLNAMQPGEKQPGKTLVLVGGEGKHFGWSDDTVYRVVQQLAQSIEAITITDSRRTPAALRQRLQSEFSSRYQPWESCTRSWLHEQLARAETAWVTEDSVSMIYESLSAGCRVGLVGLQGGNGRLTRGIARLEADGLVVRWALGPAQSSERSSERAFEQRAPALPTRAAALNEAERVALQLIG